MNCIDSKGPFAGSDKPYINKKTMSKPSNANPADLIAIANPTLAKKLTDKEEKSLAAEESQPTPAHQSFNRDIWRAVYALNIIRYIMAIALIFLTIVHLANNLPSIFANLTHPSLFISSIVVLVASAVGFTICTKFRLIPLNSLLVAQFGVDLVITGLLTYSTGGLSSSFTWLFFVVVATGSVVLRRVQALGLASAAILIMLYEHLYITLSTGTSSTSKHLDFVVYALVLMGTAWFISALAQRLRHTDIKSYNLGDESIEDYLVREEIAALKSALESTGGNKTEAAKLVGMTFRSFRYKVSKYEIN